jgi:hypothetical protein
MINVEEKIIRLERDRQPGVQSHLPNGFDGRRRGLNAFEPLVFSAAAKDSEYWGQLDAFGARVIGPARFLSPSELLHAVWSNLWRPAGLTAQPDAPL